MTATLESTTTGLTSEQRAKQANRRLHRAEHRWALAFVAAPILGFLLLAYTVYRLVVPLVRAAREQHANPS